MPNGQLNARLRVIQDTPQEQTQDCGSCRNQSNCWAPGIKEEHIITNLLVCRMKRGIDVNRSSKLFLQMVRPKLKTFAKYAVRDTNLDIRIALSDMESQTIDYLLNDYVMGERAYPLHYLFSPVKGVIMYFANNYARKERRYEDTHTLEETSDERAEADSHEEENAETELTRRARAIVDDGVTLTAQEYRVLKFCLTNATEAKRPLNGLHVYLARTMGIVRARATKVFSDASKKMVQEAQASN